jgi:hypothetical protein
MRPGRQAIAAAPRRCRTAASQRFNAGAVPVPVGARSRRRFGGPCADRGTPGRPVKFWDASAILPLLVAVTTTERLQALAQRDPDMLAWWGSAVKCASALARLEREAALDAKSAELAFQRLRLIADAWHEVEPRRLSARTRSDSCASIPCGRPMRCSSPRRSLPRNAARIASGGQAGRTPCRCDAQGRVRAGRHCGRVIHPHHRHETPSC